MYIRGCGRRLLIRTAYYRGTIRVFALVLFCKSMRCARCRAIRLALAFERVRLCPDIDSKMELSIDRKRYGMCRWCCERALYKGVEKLMKRINRRFRPPVVRRPRAKKGERRKQRLNPELGNVEYFSRLEWTRREGVPHLHFLLRRAPYIPHEWLKAAAVECGLGIQCFIKRVDAEAERRRAEPLAARVRKVELQHDAALVEIGMMENFGSGSKRRKKALIRQARQLLPEPMRGAVDYVLSDVLKVSKQEVRWDYAPGIRVLRYSRRFFDYEPMKGAVPGELFPHGQAKLFATDENWEELVVRGTLAKWKKDLLRRHEMNVIVDKWERRGALVRFLRIQPGPEVMAQEAMKMIRRRPRR